ncbi:DUF6265 family protein [Flammeovirgaceae bacterium SG7u.111]|nr:DUF6265 family protein [Flammeovirgaceae bacterium SG7u.132]WPO38205.1 DUF6265 family protein [Flammeovirgaceae bacterium SG7u.111]
MKNLWVFFLVFLVLSCKSDESSTQSAPEQKAQELSFDWLVGDWQRSNEKAGKKTFETWRKKNIETYQGTGFTIQNNDTIWQEQIMLVGADDAWNFEVLGKGDTEPTVFKLTQIEKELFVCENPENEFPKVIKYAKSGDGIKAVISGGGEEVLFLFEKRSFK